MTSFYTKAGNRMTVTSHAVTWSDSSIPFLLDDIRSVVTRRAANQKEWELHLYGDHGMFEIRHEWATFSTEQEALSAARATTDMMHNRKLPFDRIDPSWPSSRSPTRAGTPAPIYVPPPRPMTQGEQEVFGAGCLLAIILVGFFQAFALIGRLFFGWLRLVGRYPKTTLPLTAIALVGAVMIIVQFREARERAEAEAQQRQDLRTFGAGRQLVDDQPTIVSISAGKRWQPSGVAVSPGDTVIVEVIEGAWYDGSDRSGGEGGNYVCGRFANNCFEPVPDAPRGMLIGRVGTQIFEIGRRNTLEIDQPGQLLLAMNVDPNGLHTTGGSLKVQIVQPI